MTSSRSDTSGDQVEICTILKSAADVQRKELEDIFHLPLVAAARHCNLGTTAFKRLCRAHGIARWPSRRIRALQNLQTHMSQVLSPNIPSKALLKIFESDCSKAVQDIREGKIVNANAVATRLDCKAFRRLRQATYRLKGGSKLLSQS